MHAMDESKLIRYTINWLLRSLHTSFTNYISKNSILHTQLLLHTHLLHSQVLHKQNLTPKQRSEMCQKICTV